MIRFFSNEMFLNTLLQAIIGKKNYKAVPDTAPKRFKKVANLGIYNATMNIVKVQRSLGIYFQLVLLGKLILMQFMLSKAKIPGNSYNG